jgi:hypothetical protein
MLMVYPLIDVFPNLGCISKLDQEIDPERPALLNAFDHASSAKRAEMTIEEETAALVESANSHEVAVIVIRPGSLGHKYPLVQELCQSGFHVYVATDQGAVTRLTMERII